MALTRKYLSAMGIDADKIDEIIAAHAETVDGLKDELAKARAEAGRLPEVQRELDGFKKAAEELEGKNPYKVKYEALKEKYDTYKADVEAKETRKNKSNAYRALLKEAGIAEKRIESVLKVSDVDGVELGEDGKIKDAGKLLDGIRAEWSDFIDSKGEPENNSVRVDFGGSLQHASRNMTVDEIMKIEDDAKRQQAIAENHTLFGF